MKLTKVLMLGAVASLLSGCFALNNVRDISFSPSDLPETAYEGYWAMSDDQGVNNTIKFNRDGTAKLYRFECLSTKQYKEKAHESYRMGGVGNQTVNLYITHMSGENAAGMLGPMLIDHLTLRFDGTTENGEMAQMTQLVGHQGTYTYARLPSAKPICTNPRLEKKVQQKNQGK